MHPSANRHSAALRRYFAGLTEFAFETRLGVADPPLVEYLGDLLTRFVHNETVFHVRNLTGKRLDAVADMLVEADARVGEARREVHRHIGDFTLFWSGVYPEALEHFQRGTRKDFFLNYCEHGKRAYYIASTIPTRDDKQDENALLNRLSHEFEMCAMASPRCAKSGNVATPREILALGPLCWAIDSPRVPPGFFRRLLDAPSLRPFAGVLA